MLSSCARESGARCATHTVLQQLVNYNCSSVSLKNSTLESGYPSLLRPTGMEEEKIIVITFVTIKDLFYLCNRYEQYEICNHYTYTDAFGQVSGRVVEFGLDCREHPN